jgi:xanthine dehydrogenase/oxidase
MPSNFLFVSEPEEIFCSSEVKFYNQPVGIILAKTNELANKAADLIDVCYESSELEMKTNFSRSLEFISALSAREIVLSFEDRLLETDAFTKSAESELSLGATKKLSGRFDCGSQYHFSMEPQTCVVVPIEDGLDVHSSTQWMDLTQIAIAEALGVQNNTINMHVRRLGGGFGAKISRPAQVACAASIAAYHLNRPVRMILSLEANMNIVGKRYACINDYQVEVDDNGKVRKLENNYVEDYGCSTNESGMVHH